MESAVADLSSAMNSSTEDTLIAKWLFPEVEHIANLPPRWISDMRPLHNGLNWKDKELNEEQKVSMPYCERKLS
jgi:hypothetical protein